MNLKKKSGFGAPSSLEGIAGFPHTKAVSLPKQPPVQFQPMALLHVLLSLPLSCVNSVLSEPKQKCQLKKLFFYSCFHYDRIKTVNNVSVSPCDWFTTLNLFAVGHCKLIDKSTLFFPNPDQGNRSAQYLLNIHVTTEFTRTC